MLGELCFKMSKMMLGYHENFDKTNKLIDSADISNLLVH